jgi:hypothetical protein
MSWEMKERLDAKLAKEARGLKFVVAPTNVTFVIKVDFDSKVEKAAMADPLLRKDFDDAGQDTIERFVEFVGLKMKSTDQQVGKLVDQNKMAEAAAMKAKMNSDIEPMRGSAQQFGVQQVQRAWTDLGKKKKEYTKYKIKIVVTISAASAGLATSIGLLAATGFSGGASGVIGVVGMVNSVVTISKQVVAAGMEVEQAEKTLVLLKQIDRFKVAQKSVEELAKRVQLIKGFRGDAYRILDNALLATDLLLSPLSGNALVSGAANIAMNVAPLAATLAIDRITKVALEGTLRE